MASARLQRREPATKVCLALPFVRGLLVARSRGADTARYAKHAQPSQAKAHRLARVVTTEPVIDPNDSWAKHQCKRYRDKQVFNPRGSVFQDLAQDGSRCQPHQDRDRNDPARVKKPPFKRLGCKRPERPRQSHNTRCHNPRHPHCRAHDFGPDNSKHVPNNSYKPHTCPLTVNQLKWNQPYVLQSLHGWDRGKSPRRSNLWALQGHLHGNMRSKYLPTDRRSSWGRHHREPV